MPLLGELAALTTSLCWAGGSILFTRAGRRAGAFSLNQARVTLAFLILGAASLATHGTGWAPGASQSQVGLLLLSGFLGLTVGDLFYFRAFVLVGPRRTTVLMTLAPPFTALLAIPFLGEHLTALAFLGMALTLTGVLLVTLDRQPGTAPHPHRLTGVIYGCLGSLGQAMGLILSKMGMGDSVDPLPATAIRMAAGTVGIWIMALALKRVHGLVKLARDPVARTATLGATVLGPVIGVWLSLVAVKHTDTGIAATLIATTPVLILPMVILFQKERVSGRALAGALVSVSGVAVLFLR